MPLNVNIPPRIMGGTVLQVQNPHRAGEAVKVIVPDGTAGTTIRVMVPGPPNPNRTLELTFKSGGAPGPFRVPVCAPRTLNAAGQFRVTLSPRQEH